MVRVKEIFTSIQGEGPYVGYKQLFIRFCGCNLNCSYCDTEYDLENAKEYTLKELVDICNSNKDCHSLSLTGGEPLLHADFIKELAPKAGLPVYLETNGTLYEELENVIDLVRYISADIKLPSTTGLGPLWDFHDKFFSIALQKELFAKVVFDNNITEEEIEKTVNLCKKYDTDIILQPVMDNDKPKVSSECMSDILNKFLLKYPKTRLIPQVHKFLRML